MARHGTIVPVARARNLEATSRSARVMLGVSFFSLAAANRRFFAKHSLIIVEYN
jgi:hypothetical protein